MRGVTQERAKEEVEALGGSARYFGMVADISSPRSSTQAGVRSVWKEEFR